MEQNKELPNTSLHIRSKDFSQEYQDHSKGKGEFSTNNAGKTGYSCAKEQNLSYTIYKN